LLFRLRRRRVRSHAAKCPRRTRPRAVFANRTRGTYLELIARQFERHRASLIEPAAIDDGRGSAAGRNRERRDQKRRPRAILKQGVARQNQRDGASI
jgi:hypothetical protein